jgi:hypothetical protein
LCVHDDSSFPRVVEAPLCLFCLFDGPGVNAPPALRRWFAEVKLSQNGLKKTRAVAVMGVPSMVPVIVSSAKPVKVPELREAV